MNVLEIEFHGGVLHLNGRPAAEWVAEVYRLREENFRLAAGQCTSANADEGGRPYCAEAARLGRKLTAIHQIAGELAKD